MDSEAAPQPRSPPRIPDLCGRQRLTAHLHLLSREIAFLEEEIQSIEGLQPASMCCKEVEEYVEMIPDPLLPIYKKTKKRCHFWSWLSRMVCLDIPTCCSGGCCSWYKKHWCDCRPTWTYRSTCWRCPCSSCCSRLKCVSPSFSCPGCSCGCVCSCSECTKVCICPRMLVLHQLLCL
ncbi:guanine nucleotide-binding protein subunit gamma 3-like isoform X1 [Curcuma longa]|uniref:guanine nucleotide-binding protein subunit gamma 3-like isoform X1 n=1 Tax=Curcuma longa TaxID=136217 RepID=UPI003D9DB7BE